MTFNQIGKREPQIALRESIILQEPLYCPKCNRGPLDGLSGVAQTTDGSKPSEEAVRPSVGDVTVCLFCSEIVEFDENLKLRLMSDARRQELEADKEYWEMMQKVRMAADKFSPVLRLCHYFNSEGLTEDNFDERIRNHLENAGYEYPDMPFAVELSENGDHFDILVSIGYMSKSFPSETKDRDKTLRSAALEVLRKIAL